MNSTATEWKCRASEYHADPRLSASKLCDFMESPALYYARHVTGELTFPSSHAMAFGTAVHAMVLEPDTPFVMAPTSRKGSKDYIEQNRMAGKLLKGYEDDDQDPILIKDSDFELARACANAVENNLGYRTLREKVTNCEFTLVYHDPHTGIPMRSRMDMVCMGDSGKLMVLDLKTTRDPSPGAMGKSSGALRYHNKMAVYRQALALHCGVEASEVDMKLVCVRSTAPYEVALYKMDSAILDIGDKQNRKGLEDLADCMAVVSDFGDARETYQPDWSCGESYLEIPEWYLK